MRTFPASSFLVVAAALMVFWPSLFLPFIQDDWRLLLFFQSNDTRSVINGIFSTDQDIFFRPLGNLYLYLGFKLFGDNPFPFQLIALIIHAMNALLVGKIINKIVPNEYLPGLLTACLYASSISILLDPLAWVAGIYDVAGAFFFFSSLYCYLKARKIFSFMLFVVGCFFKEAVVILPLIFFAHQLFVENGFDVKRTVQKHWKVDFIFLFAMVLVASIKLANQSPLDFPDDHPYVMEFLGLHLIRNTFAYFAWMLQSFFPFFLVRSWIYQVIVLCFIAVLGYGIKIIYSRSSHESKGQMLFLLSWSIIALLPVLFLPNHVYKYYATYSLPAFIIFSILTVKAILDSRTFDQKTVKLVQIGICAFGIVGSVIQSQRIYNEGTGQKTLMENSNQLIRRAAYSEIIINGLKEHIKSLPKNSTIVIGNAELWSVDRSSGPRFIFKDDTLQVYDLKDLKFEGDQPYIDNPIQDQIQAYTGAKNERIEVDKDSLFAFKVDENKLIKIDPQKLK